MQVVIDEEELFGLAADVLVRWHAVQVNLVEDGTGRTHHRVLVSSDAVMESLASDVTVSVVSVLFGTAFELGFLEKLF